MKVVNHNLLKPFRAENRKLLDERRKDSGQRMEKLQAAIMEKMENRKQKLLLKI